MIKKHLDKEDFDEIKNADSGLEEEMGVVYQEMAEELGMSVEEVKKLLKSLE